MLNGNETQKRRALFPFRGGSPAETERAHLVDRLCDFYVRTVVQGKLTSFDEYES
jgi:hypothetical protein